MARGCLQLAFVVFILFFIKLAALTGEQDQGQDQEPPIYPAQIKRVHLVFMNHLDVGYDGIHPTTGFAVNVMNRYFSDYYPRAISLAEGLRVFGYRERFIYTTHPWLLYLYLHCTPFTLASNVTLQCPNASAVTAMQGAISQGDIAWHAGPMNMQIEFMHPTHFDLSLNFAAMLDAEFEINRTSAVLSQRDVPGMTKAAIPILKKHKIAGISVGVNGMTSPPAFPPYVRSPSTKSPDIPSVPFIWKFSSFDDEGIIAFWHPGGYPNNPGRFPNTPGGLSASDCVFNFDDLFPQVLCFAFRTDNSGPPESIAEILNNYEVVRAQFPNAIVRASTLDNFVSTVQIRPPIPIKVITQEVGDTWIMGIQSDPRKVAYYRTFARVLADCVEAGECGMNDSWIVQALLYLTKVPEHTWGLNTVGDFKNWTNDNFQKARSGKNYKDCEANWQEQRQFLEMAFKALASHPVTARMVDEGRQLTPIIPDLSDYEPVTDISSPQSCANGVVVKFASDGSLVQLHDPFNDVDWASNKNRMGQIIYRTYNESDYDRMSSQYDYKGSGGAGFHKVNSTQYAHPVSRTWPITLQQLYRKKGTDSCDFIVKAGPANEKAVTSYGAPPLFYIQYQSANQTDKIKGGFEVVVQWFKKGPTRLSEEVSFQFTPTPQSAERWTLSKLGSVVDPSDVILNGSQYLHAIDKGANFSSGDKGLQLLSQDVALLTLGTSSRPPSVLPVPLTPLTEPISSVAFNLYNNLWSTNYIYWYPFSQEDENFKARFSVYFV